MIIELQDALGYIEDVAVTNRVIIAVKEVWMYEKIIKDLEDRLVTSSERERDTEILLAKALLGLGTGL